MIYFSNTYRALINDDHPLYSFSRDVDLADIKTFVKERHSRERQQVCLHELGIGSVRFDFVSLNPYTHRIRVMEYKVSKSDLTNDRKWPGYLPYCNALTFVMPLGIVDPKSNIILSKESGLGLLEVFRWSKKGEGSLPKKSSLGGVWLRKPRYREMSKENYCGVCGMMLLRLVQGRKGDFF